MANLYITNPIFRRFNTNYCIKIKSALYYILSSIIYYYFFGQLFQFFVQKNKVLLIGSMQCHDNTKLKYEN